MHIQNTSLKNILVYFLLPFYVCLFATPAFSEPQTDSFHRQVENYAVLLAEEEIAVDRTKEFLKTASETMSSLLERYQKAIATGGASSTSPITKKQFETAVTDILEQGNTLSGQLQGFLREAKLRSDFLKSYSSVAGSYSSGHSQMISTLLKEVGAKVSKLSAETEGQAIKIENIQRQVQRLVQRMEKTHRNDKQSLYDTWVQYLLITKTPIFTIGFWDSPLPDKRWFSLKKINFIAGLSVVAANGLKLTVLFLTLAIIGMSSKRLVKFLPDKKADDSVRKKVGLYFTIAVSGLSMYLARTIVFPTGMDSLSALAAALFLFGILKLAKYICNDSFLTNSGHTRIFFLFLVSTQLLVLHLPSRSVTLIFILIVLAFWGSDTLQAWRHKGLHLKKTAMRGGSLTPLFIFSFFGYGRLTCMLTIIWCLGIFIRAFGSIWSQSLFIETDKSSKLQKGLAKSLLVPLGWAVAFGLTYMWLVDFLGENTLSSILQLKASFGTYSLYLNDVIILVVLFFLTYNCIAAFKVSIDHVGSKWQKAKRGAVPSIQTLTTYATWSLFTLLALRILGVSLTSITVIAGGLSVGIGFGLQNVVNNFISGLILLFGRSIQQGDVIEVGGMWCTVKKINIRTTLVETFESAVIMIPNSDLVTTQVTNWTKNNPTLRRDILIGVVYGSDTKKVEETLLAVADAHPHVLKKPEPFILFNDFGASSLDFILRVWVDDIDHTIRTTSELRFAIDDAFREAGIEIAFPQMDVHFKTAPALAGHMKLMDGTE